MSPEERFARTFRAEFKVATEADRGRLTHLVMSAKTLARLFKLYPDLRTAAEERGIKLIFEPVMPDEPAHVYPLVGGEWTGDTILMEWPDEEKPLKVSGLLDRFGEYLAKWKLKTWERPES